jgi:heptosyltransferase II
MTAPPEKVLVFHTAFIGDIILMFPMLQVLRHHFPDCRITVVTIPAVADLVKQHPAVDEVIPYDKRGSHHGWGGALSLVRRLKGEQFSLALVPHRSLRSALIVSLAGVPRRIGFSTSAGAWLFTGRVTYRSTDHEIDRNLALLEPVIGCRPDRVLPKLGRLEKDVHAVDAFQRQMAGGMNGDVTRPLVAIAPGSVWSTKRWPSDSFAELATRVMEAGCTVVLVGGERDMELCTSIAVLCHQPPSLLNAAGRLTLPESAELLRRCAALVSNDSAPMHMAMGVGIPVVALFGPTVRAIGFAPVGPHDQVVEVAGLPCRPCNIHGGNECPIGSFACMRGIPVEQVLNAVLRMIAVHNAG